MSDVTELDEAGLVRLDEFLGSERRPQECMVLDELDGFLTALVCSADDIPPEEWLAEVWGDADPQFADAAEEEDVLALIYGLRDSIAEELRESDVFEPMWYETFDEADNTVIEPEGWCSGFMRGTQLNDDKWEPLFNSEELHTLLAPIVAFAVYQLPDSANDPLLRQLADDEALRQEFIEAIPVAVKNLHQHFSAVRH